MAVRYFLMAPASLAASDILACATAACAAGDCAAIVVPETITPEGVAALQELGLAVLIADAEPHIVSRLKADGLHLSSAKQDIRALRPSLPGNAMIGLDCGTSRHAAMEAAEHGADYVGFHQAAQTTGEPLVKWWNELAEIPAVPLDPASAQSATVLSKQSDFIRPGDEMWHNPAAASRVITELNDTLK